MAPPSVPSPPNATDWTIRPFGDSDRAALLRLNADNYPSVHTLDETTLAWLLSFDGHHLVAEDRSGTVLGYPGEKDYAIDDVTEAVGIMNLSRLKAGALT